MGQIFTTSGICSKVNGKSKYWVFCQHDYARQRGDKAGRSHVWYLGHRGRSECPGICSKVKRNLRDAHQFARDHLKTAQSRQKRDYDLRLSERSYEVGDLVYKLHAASKTGQSKKLSKVWDGPYLVTKFLSPVLFKIKGCKQESIMTD